MARTILPFPELYRLALYSWNGLGKVLHGSRFDHVRFAINVIRNPQSEVEPWLSHHPKDTALRTTPTNPVVQL